MTENAKISLLKVITCSVLIILSGSIIFLLNDFSYSSLALSAILTLLFGGYWIYIIYFAPMTLGINFLISIWLMLDMFEKELLGAIIQLLSAKSSSKKLDNPPKIGRPYKFYIACFIFLYSNDTCFYI